MPTLCAYVHVYALMFACVCERHHAHITIERLPRQLLPWCLQCHVEYGRRRINTCPIFPQSPPISIGPRTSTGSVAAGWHGLALLQLLPLVSNKHMISLCECRGTSWTSLHDQAAVWAIPVQPVEAAPVLCCSMCVMARYYRNGGVYRLSRWLGGTEPS